MKAISHLDHLSSNLGGSIAPFGPFGPLVWSLGRQQWRAAGKRHTVIYVFEGDDEGRRGKEGLLFCTFF